MQEACRVQSPIESSSRHPLELESFRSEYEYEFEYEYDFCISNQLLSQNRHFSLLLISRSNGFRNNIGVLFDDLEYIL